MPMPIRTRRPCKASCRSRPPAARRPTGDRKTAVDDSSPELAAGRLRTADRRPELVPAPRTHQRVRLFHSVVRAGLLAHGKNRPNLRWLGVGAYRQQNKTPGRRSNQGSAEQGESASARNRPCRTSFSRAARLVPESVNFMGELTTNPLWDTETKDYPSQYARMIPGISAMPHLRVVSPTLAPTVDATPAPPVNANKEAIRRRQGRTLFHQLL